MKNRFEFAVALSKNSNKTILDLGSRDKILKKYLKKNDIEYQGIDFEEDIEVISFNLENGIPFEDNTFDIVYALDVLEHLENIHFLMNEIHRVAKYEVVIALPNCYHWHYKINIFRNKPINTKYKIPGTKILDRHRWVTYSSANIELVNIIFNKYKITHYCFICNYKRYKFLYKIDKFLSKYYPNNFSYTDFFHIEINKTK